MRLIDADELIETLHDMTHHPGGYLTMREIEDTVERAPTVALPKNSITLEWTPDVDNLSKEVAERALDEFEYNGRTIREWVEAIMTLPEPPEEVSGK